MQIKICQANQIEDKLTEILGRFTQQACPEMPEYYNNEIAFALYDGEKLIGGLTASEKVKSFHISMLTVDDAYRNKGYGRLLVEAAIEKAKELGCHHVSLTTFSYQGEHFYPRFGFEKMGEIKDFPIAGVSKIYFIKYLGGQQ
jgi:GNAT superfamily N-acetyltransferase